MLSAVVILFKEAFTEFLLVLEVPLVLSGIACNTLGDFSQSLGHPAKDVLVAVFSFLETGRRHGGPNQGRKENLDQGHAFASLTNQCEQEH